MTTHLRTHSLDFLMTETDVREHPPVQPSMPVPRRVRRSRTAPFRGFARLPVRRSSVALGVLILLLIGSAVWFYLTTAGVSAQSAREEQALGVARQTVVNLLTIDPASAAATLQRVEDASTGEFKQQLVAQGDQFHSVVTDSKVTATGSISEAGVRSSTPDEVIVLISAVGLVKNTETPAGEQRQYRMVLDLRRDAATGSWLVAKLDFVP
jgi:Mce-associated membrane protein